MGDAMGSALKIRTDFTSAELRRHALRELSGRSAARLYAIADALDGLSRKEAADRAGIDRQTLRDAVIRFNEEGLAGVHDRPKGHRRRHLTEDEEAQFAATIEIGPDPERDGVSAWTRADMCQWIEDNFSKTYHPSSLSRVLRRMGFSRQKIRPSSPKADAVAQERFKRGGSAKR